MINKVVITLIIILITSTLFSQDLLTPIQTVEEYIKAHNSKNWSKKYIYISNEYKMRISLKEYEEANKNMDLLMQKIKTKFPEEFAYLISNSYPCSEYIYGVLPLNKFKVSLSNEEDRNQCKVDVEYEIIQQHGVEGREIKTIFLKKEDNRWKIVNPFIEYNKYVHINEVEERYKPDTYIYKIYHDNNFLREIETLVEGYISVFVEGKLEEINKYLIKKKDINKYLEICKGNLKNIRILKVIDCLVTFSEPYPEEYKINMQKEGIKLPEPGEEGGCSLYLLIDNKGKLMFGYEELFLVREDRNWKIGGSTAFESLNKWENIRPFKWSAEQFSIIIKKMIENQDYESVEEFYNKLLEKYPNSKEAKELEDKIIEVKFLEAKKCLEKGYGGQEVLEFYNKLKKEYPDSKWTKELEKLMDKEAEKNIK